MKNNIFGKNLKELRLEKGLTQRELAKNFDVWNQAISAWENGEREPDYDRLVEIAKFFEVSVEYLLEEKH